MNKYVEKGMAAALLFATLTLACGSPPSGNADEQPRSLSCSEQTLEGMRCVRYFDPQSLEPPHCGTIVDVDCDRSLYLFDDDNFDTSWIDGSDMTCPIPPDELCDGFE